MPTILGRLTCDYLVTYCPDRGGKTRVLSLRLKPSLRRRLAKSGALRVSVTGAARDAAGNRAPIAARLRLLAPSRR